MTAGGGLDAFIVVVALVAGAVVGSVWLTAMLAMLLVGGAATSVGFGDAAEALVGLPAHLGDPAAAWAPELRASLPGPFLYWACQIVVLAAVTVLTRLAWRVFRPRAERDGLGVERSARFATRRDLRRLAVSGPTPGRIVLGRAGGQLVATEPKVSLCVVGPSQSHKTSGLCIPAVLDLGEGQGAAIVASVKGDIYAATARRRRGLGSVKVFDPTCVAVGQSATWSPLRAAHTASGAQAAARALVDVAGDASSLENGGFWMKSAKELLWPMLYVAAASGGTMDDVVRWVLTQDRPSFDDKGNVRALGDVASRIGILEARAKGVDPATGEVLDEAEDDEDGEGPVDAEDGSEGAAAIPKPDLAEVTRAGNALAGLWSYDERTRSSIYATARTIVEAWTDPVVAASSRGCDITPEWLLDGDNTLYIVAPARDQARLRPLFSCMVADLVNEAFDAANRNGGELERKLLVLLDEAANICPIKELPAWCSTCPSHGITLVTVWQDRSQQRQRYGPDGAETVWNNSGAKVLLSGLADRASAEVSSLLGEEDHERMGSQVEVLSSARRTLTSQTTARRLVTEDALRRQELGQGLLIYRDLPPVRLALRSTHNDRRLRRVQGGVLRLTASAGAPGRERRAS